MGNRYHHLAFGPESIARQERAGSIVAYGADLGDPVEPPMTLGTREITLLTNAFQLHMATVTPAGWPYLQYRSGPPGFVHVLDNSRIAFADFHGNNQFVSIGNIESDQRVALFVADFKLRQRLKVFGHGTVVEAAADPELLAQLRQVDGGEITARCERSVVIEIEAFDWNCSRSLVPQYRREEVREMTEPYVDEIRELRAELKNATRA